MISINLNQLAQISGNSFSFETTHTFSDEQLEWFKAGSALNVIRAQTT